MIDPKLILLFAVFVAMLAGSNIVRTLRTGIARNWLAQTATRSGQPVIYWRYVYTSYAVFAFCGVTFLWASLWPESLR